MTSETEKQRLTWDDCSRSEKIAAISAGATLAGAFFAAFAFFAALRAADEAGRQADIAQDNLFVSDRPWIKVEKISINQFSIYEGFVLGLAHVPVKNFGHSPAISLFVNSELKPLDLSQQSLDVTTAICKSAREKRKAPTLQVVFPDESKSGESNVDEGDTVPVSLYISSEEMIRAKKAYLEDQFVREKALLGNEKAAKRKHEAEVAPFKTAFSLAGCVTYFSYRGLIGQTSFVVNVYRRVHSIPVLPDFVDDKGSFDMSQIGDVPLDEINTVAITLGRVDGFDQDDGASEGDERAVVLGGLFA